MKIIIAILAALILTGCSTLTPWGNVQTGNKIISTHSAKRTILVITTEGESAEESLVEAMKDVRLILTDRWSSEGSVK